MDFSKTIKTCTCPVPTAVVLIRIGRQPSVACVARAV